MSGPRLAVVCPVCRETHESDGDQWLRVAVEIGWFSGSGGTPETFGLDGLCEPCADRAYNAAANLLRDLAGLPPVTLEDEPGLRDEDAGS